MAVRFAVQGVQVECDNASEAAELIAAIAAKSQPAAKKPPESPPATNGDHREGGFAALWAALKPQHRAFLVQVVDKHPDPAVGDAIGVELGLDTNGVGWLRRKIEAVAGELGVDVDRLYEVVRVDVDGRPKRAYMATPLLRREVAGVRAGTN